MSLVPKNDANLKKCLCPTCPSYNECAKGKAEKLYCCGDIGKSGCEFKTNGCLCGGCPVHYDYSLTAFYYCMHGSAEAIG